MGIQYQQENTFTRGLPSLDVRFGKPSVRELIIMFGYSGIGKTEYTYFVARRNAEEGNRVMYMSLELPEYDMKQRICLSRAGVSKYEFQTGKFTTDQKYVMDTTWDKIDKLENLKITGQEDKSLRSIDTNIRRGYDEGYRMFIVDNLDKVTYNGSDNENTRYQTITSQLQDLKNELGICIILIHHAKKALNSQQASLKAGIDGLRGSQKIVDNSTQVFEVYRDLDPDDEGCHNITEIHQLKDTFGGPKGYEKIQYSHGTYVEYLPPSNNNAKGKSF